MFCPKCGRAEEMTESTVFDDDGCTITYILAMDFYKNKEAYKNHDDPETSGYVGNLVTVTCEHCGFEFYYREG